VKEKTMNRIQKINGAPLAHAFEDAVSGRSIVGICWKVSGAWTALKGRFTPAPELAQDGFAIATLPFDSNKPAPAAGDTVGVSFRRGHRKWMFETTVIECQIPNPGSNHEPLLIIRKPESVQAVQRRMYERAAPSPGVQIQVQFSPQEHSDVAGLTGRLRDLSAGGMSIDLDGKIPWSGGQTVNCTICQPETEATINLEAVVRHCESLGSGGSILGLQFVGLEASADGRKTLDAILGLVVQLQCGGRNAAPALTTV
jgi:c-di-GMP-binding flagellar brake protein YcgR